MPLVILLVLVGGAVLEVWAVLRVADLIGAAPTALLLVLGSALGLRVLSRGTTRAWRRVAAASRSGERLEGSVLDAGLTVLAGVLLLVPGLISGALGLLLLLPPVRAVLRPALGFLVLRRVSLPVILGTRGATWAAGRTRGRDADAPFDVDGTATEQRRPGEGPTELPDIAGHAVEQDPPGEAPPGPDRPR